MGRHLETSNLRDIALGMESLSAVQSQISIAIQDNLSQQWAERILELKSRETHKTWLQYIPDILLAYAQLRVDPLEGRQVFFYEWISSFKTARFLAS